MINLVILFLYIPMLRVDSNFLTSGNWKQNRLILKPSFHREREMRESERSLFKFQHFLFAPSLALDCLLVLYQQIVER